MYFLYSLFYSIGFIAFLPRLLYGAFRHGKYLPGFKQRMGHLSPISTSGDVIWLHCVSVGEVQAARPVVRELLERFPSHELVISTITVTGQLIAREIFRTEAKMIFYFPFDWAWVTRRSLSVVNPSLVIIMETELWPRFLRECHRRGVSTALVNGRISPRSFRRYKLIRAFMTPVLKNLDLAIMQTSEDAARIGELGIDEKIVTIAGNVKFDVENNAEEKALASEFSRRFRLDNGRPLLIAASTHATEEQTVLAAFEILRLSPSLAPRLIIAPRHPERFENVASLLQASGLRWTRRSGLPSQEDADVDLILLDTIGELRGLYSFATLVFVGGSISRNGGHNVLEPASAGVCTITGAHTENFSFIVETLVKAGGLVQLPDVSGHQAVKEIANVFADLLMNDHRRQAYVRRATEIIDQNRGASARTIRLLSPLFAPRGLQPRANCTHLA